MTLLTPEENQGGGDDSSTIAAADVDSDDDLTSSLLLDSIGSNLDTDDLSPGLIQIRNPVPCLKPVLDCQDILSGLEREKQSPSRFSVDVECESVVSDYSEVGGPLRDFERDVTYMDKDSLRAEDSSSFLALSSSFWEPEELERREGESEEDFERRVRKVNLLSLAQEFAELKKLDAQACAINFHRNQSTRSFGHGGSPLSSRGQSLERTNRRTASKSPLRSLGRGSSKDTHRACPIMIETDDNKPKHQNTSNKTSRDMVVPKSEDLPVNEARRRDSNSDLPANMRPDRCANSPGLAGHARKSNPGSRDGSASRSAAARNQSSQGSSDVEGDFDVYNIETALPNVNWEILEKQLQAAAEEESKRLESCKNEREEIRKRLAMSADEEFGFGTDDDSVGASETLSPRKQRLQARLQGAPNGMQICFMNDDVLDDDEDDEANDAGDVQTSADEGEANQTESAIPPPNHPCFPGEIQEFTNRQTQLQSEATLALAQASTMARMQLEVEKQGKKKSPVADMVGIPTLGQGRRLRLNRGKLQEMNIAQLQVLVNDLHSQIELLNEDLVHLLIERDDLHMEQDSMLVDIEDLTRYGRTGTD
ncbi:uncharacterized protein LOC131943456 isoform X2 [Physella acuta]|uniref:uncharacterized protein LOC131943456 isoform X2 n=1 Tax=Physella acuta TaxID=109671 RepID=UPI0027DC995F|nr:uncharacterized protein LOC131943456 isoform X2 [Physella acuta]